MGKHPSLSAWQLAVALSALAAAPLSGCGSSSKKTSGKQSCQGALCGEGGAQEGGAQEGGAQEGGAQEGGGGDAATEAPAPGSLGASCKAASDCTSGYCVDGVCCNGACNGTCEACNLPGEVGSCSAIPAGQDPDKECASLAPPPDSGLEGGTFVPDGGDSTLCSPSCNGHRACAYPGADVTCGAHSCEGLYGQQRVVCDGRGACDEQVNESCNGVICDPDAGVCPASCKDDSECNPSMYCVAGTCTPRRALGTACSVDDQCSSGHCVGSICCDSACGAGATCTAPGSVGTCTCAAPCGDGGTCAPFYKDADHDGYGVTADKTMACLNAPPPGYVAYSGGDCDDTNPDVHPGAPAQPNPRPNGSWDWNCDGTIEKSTAEVLNGACWTCQTNFTCNYDLCQGSGIVGPPAFGGPCCDTEPQKAFTKTVDCGKTGTLLDCSACASNTTTAVQTCR